MTLLMREALSHWPHGNLSGFAMILFMGVFFGVAYRTYSVKGAERCSEAECLPLQDLNPVSKSEEKINE